MTDPRDERWMRLALGLAARGLGRVWPNPAVGCVIVRRDDAGRDRVVGRGWTQRGGRPHAETETLKAAGEAARGATAYVSLEPCAHQGHTGPCAKALIEAGIGRVVATIEDPDPRVSGAGLRMLRDAGVEVESGCLEAAAKDLNEGFLLRVARQRPLVSLKLALSLDGRIAAGDGRSKWLTGDAARNVVHWLRATHDAVLVGSETVLADDPQLTCRLSGLEDRSPIRIVVDRRLRIPIGSRLVDSAGAVPLWIFTGLDAAERAADVLHRVGAEVFRLSAEAMGDRMMAHVLLRLGERGITRLLVEGGSRVAGALLAADLVDRLYLFQAPVMLGSDALPAFDLKGLGAPDQAPRWRPVAERHLGADLLRVYEPSRETGI